MSKFINGAVIGRQQSMHIDFACTLHIFNISLVGKTAFINSMLELYGGGETLLQEVPNLKRGNVVTTASSNYCLVSYIKLLAFIMLFL